jgi:hypothetical protein
MADDSTFERYELRRRLGKGGMGVVYRAWDTIEEREVALKIGEVPLDEAAAGRLMREVRCAAAVRDPHVCAVYRTGTSDTGAVFLAMELIEGPTFLRLAKRRASGPSLWLEALRALALGLAAAHRQDIIHRDVKPQNVMFDAAGVLKLLDFGIARAVEDDTVTASGALIGTAAYMSPEQARGERLDARSDLFSAALTVASLAGRGRARFGDTNGTVAQRVMRVAYWPPPLLMDFHAATPPELEDLLSQVLTMRPEHRVGSAAALVELIDACPLRHPRGEAWLRDWVTGVVDDDTACAFDAARELERARRLAADPAHQTAYALALRRASLLDPRAGAGQALDEAAGRAGFRFAEDWDEPRQQLLDRFEHHPPEPDELRRGFELFRRSGHIEMALRLLWSYVRARPDDVAAVRQLDRALCGAMPTPSLSIARGVRTGGLAALAKPDPPTTVLPPSPTTTVVSRAAGHEDGATSHGRMRRSDGAPPRSGLVGVIASGARGGVAADEPAWTPLIRPALLLLAAASVVWLLIFTARAARREFARADQQAEAVVRDVAVDVRVQLVDEAAAALEAKDFAGAVERSTRVLGMDPSLETGRRALLIRARGHIALGARAPARRDLEAYIERTTTFSDPTLLQAKRLLADLDAGDLGRARE